MIQPIYVNTLWVDVINAVGFLMWVGAAVFAALLHDTRPKQALRWIVGVGFWVVVLAYYWGVQ